MQIFTIPFSCWVISAAGTGKTEVFLMEASVRGVVGVVFAVSVHRGSTNVLTELVGLLGIPGLLE